MRYAEFLWVSDPEARHSRNIAVRPEIAIVIFDSTVAIGRAEALYVDALAEQLSEDGVEQAILSYSRRSRACGARSWVAADVLLPSDFRLYRARASSQSILGPGDRRLPVQVDENEAGG